MYVYDVAWLGSRTCMYSYIICIYIYTYICIYIFGIMWLYLVHILKLLCVVEYPIKSKWS